MLSEIFPESTMIMTAFSVSPGCKYKLKKLFFAHYFRLRRSCFCFPRPCPCLLSTSDIQQRRKLCHYSFMRDLQLILLDHVSVFYHNTNVFDVGFFFLTFVSLKNCLFKSYTRDLADGNCI
jgi:hypothetical protein